VLFKFTVGSVIQYPRNPAKMSKAVIFLEFGIFGIDKANRH